VFSVLLAPATLARTVTMEEYEANKEAFQTLHEYIPSKPKLSPADAKTSYLKMKKICNNKKPGKEKSMCLKSA
jgi:hypothetical protein